MDEQYTNNASTTLDGNIDGTTTSVTVSSLTRFPTSPQFRIIAANELMLVTAIDVPTKTFTVTRGIENTSAVPHLNGTLITHELTADSLLKIIQDNINQTNVYLFAECSADTNFTDSGWTDVSNCSLTITVAGIYQITANIQLRNNGSATSTAGCKLYLVSGTVNLIAGEYSLPNGYNAVFTLTVIVNITTVPQTVRLAGRDQSSAVFQARQYGDYDIGAASIPGTNISVIKIK